VRLVRAANGCGCSSGVEHNLAKVGVVGSNPIARSNIFNDISNSETAPLRRTSAECPRNLFSRRSHRHFSSPADDARLTRQESRPCTPDADGRLPNKGACPS
jgi:hypothetical protein